MREAVDDEEETGAGEQGAEHVETGLVLAPATRNEERHTNDGEAREEEVDEEAPAPRGPLGQRATEEQPDRRTGPTDGAVDREGLGALSGIAERR